MKDIVTVSKKAIGGTEVNAVNMRDVWKFVESKRDFSEWVKDRLTDLVKGEDFIVVHKTGDHRGHDGKDYVVTVDCAKAICMLERNEKGKQLRAYFIEMEKVALTKQPVLPQNYKEALRALLQSEEEKELLAASNLTLAIKVREAESFNCLAGACARFGWQQGTAQWRSAMGVLAVRVQAELGTRTEKIPDARFGNVNAHDDRVWQVIAERHPDFQDLKALHKVLGWKQKKELLSK